MFAIVRLLLLGPLLALGATSAVLGLGTGAADAASIPGTGRVSSVHDDTKVARCKLDGRYRTTRSARPVGARSGTNAQTAGAIPLCPTPTPPPTTPGSPTPGTGPLTTVSNAAFLAAAAGPAQASESEFKVPASVTLAQAILESGWGKSKLSMNDRNYFGMKCFGNPGTIAIGCHDYVTQECNAATLTCWTTTATFRVYNSPTDSFRDHGRQLATLTRYAAAFNYTNNPDQFAAEIHKAGYATDPYYTTKLVNIMTKYNLYQYDLA
jgi:flagellar protein FlgJ